MSTIEQDLNTLACEIAEIKTEIMKILNILKTQEEVIINIGNELHEIKVKEKIKRNREKEEKHENNTKTN